jgi:hypothetical protein
MIAAEAVQNECFAQDRIARLVATGYHYEFFDPGKACGAMEVGINGEPYRIGPSLPTPVARQKPRPRRAMHGPTEHEKALRADGARVRRYEDALRAARRSVLGDAQLLLAAGDQSVRVQVCICKHCAAVVDASQILEHLRAVHGILRG